MKPLFVQILMLAHEMGLLALGKVSLDGTKIKANASKRHALSWEHACKLDQQLQAEVQALLCLAEQADSEQEPLDFSKCPFSGGSSLVTILFF